MHRWPIPLRGDSAVPPETRRPLLTAEPPTASRRVWADTSAARAVTVRSDFLANESPGQTTVASPGCRIVPEALSFRDRCQCGSLD